MWAAMYRWKRLLVFVRGLGLIENLDDIRNIVVVS